MDVPPLVLLLCLHTLLLLLHHTRCKTLNTISPTIPLHDGDVLLSENKNFALGFFSPSNSTRRFIGTWYNKSFDHPSDTLMPFMKLGLDWRTGMDWVLTSWRSEDFPGPENFTYRFDPTGYPQIFLCKNAAPLWRTGPWTGLCWSGLFGMSSNYIFNFSFVNDHEEDGRWNELWRTPVEDCDYYMACGPNSNCNPYNADQFRCTCLPGFEPRSPADWFLRDGSGGCIRSPGASTCRSREGFVKVALVKLPDTSRAYVDMGLSLKECEQECLKNCSCTAYTSADERNGGFGCLAGYGDLLDMRTYSNIGQDLYIQVDAAILGTYELTYT
ncbi:hypothetical protein CRG98_036033 [Punica granatum]|uniref:non-specific serine/threonine protein kinase n=1 Tax=Punica granatum TaxID=22663 RepID=A0A2I0IHV8_PUNGR|nr:hypothetical protein CRG98_036033 [Punica granatum]